MAVSLMWGGLARAERTIAVEITGDPPFEAPQLTAAIRLRLPVDGAPVRVQVTATDEGVQVATVAGSREISLFGMTGEDAARLVALAIRDIVPDDELVGAPPRRRRRSLHELDARPPPPSLPREVDLLGAFGAWPGLGAAIVSLAIPRRSWHYAFELGGGRLIGAPLSVTTGMLRAAVGTDFGELRVQAGLTVMPVRVSDGEGDLTALVGAGASARARIPVTRGVRAVIAIGADLFANHTEYRVAGMATLATPWAMPWLGLGIEVTP